MKGKETGGMKEGRKEEDHKSGENMEVSKWKGPENKDL